MASINYTHESRIQTSVVAQWDIDGTLVEHQTNYQVLDDQHPAVSDNMLFWGAHHTGIDTAVYSDRRPEPASQAPCFAAPRMELYNKQRVNSDDPDYARDSISSDGNFILKRVMDFAMPSLERSRLVNPMLSRKMPSIGDAFSANC